MGYKTNNDFRKTSYEMKINFKSNIYKLQDNMLNYRVFEMYTSKVKAQVYQ